ncbi:protein translocase subunit SecF [Candidatus Peregrinibacteria bacterium]|nr:protein translocase subunit SecF [Candidatus Peregrinibacteria bacterium]
MRFPIIPATKFWFLISGVTLAVGLYFVFAPGFGLHLGIDFSGGSKMYLPFSETITKTEFDEIFREALGNEKGEVVVESGDKAIIVRSRDLSNQEIEQLKVKLKEKGKTLEDDAVRIETVGPTQGKVQTERGFLAVGITMLAIIMFIALAFRRVPEGLSSWKFGVSAVVALIHDVFIVIGAFALLGKYYGVEVDTLFITALLTVMGFSVHDTIVVFDRLRENLKGTSLKNLEETAEKAVWQTMARSINTSGSTLIVLLTLFFSQIEGIHFFILALVLGIIVGTYSSIFIATPMLVAWSKK